MGKFTLPRGHKFSLPTFNHLPVPVCGSAEVDLWRKYLSNDVQIQPETKLYLYLAEMSYVDAWSNGGRIPLYAARRYLAGENEGVLTKDELSQTIYKDDDGNIVEGSRLDRSIRTPSHYPGLFISFVGGIDNDGAIPNVHLEKRIDDALLLCLSTERSRHIAERLNRSYCVQLNDFDALRRSVDDALATDCQFGPVRYRSDKNRSHFVKGSENSYMKEFRIVVPNRTEDAVWVNIPVGTASEVAV